MIAGDGTLREVKKVCAGGQGGVNFLKDLLSRLGGKRYASCEELDADLEKSLRTKKEDPWKEHRRRDRPARCDF